MSVGYKIPRGTRAALDAKAVAGTIVAGQCYLLTDENRLCVGLTTSTYQDFALASENKTGSLSFVIDGGGSAITTGVKGDLELPFAGTITGYDILADQSGSIVVDIWKDTYANFPPTSADKITASAPPTISSATKATDSALTGWTKTFAAGDILRFNVNSAATVQRVTVVIRFTRA